MARGLKAGDTQTHRGRRNQNRPQPTNRWAPREGDKPTVARIEPLFATYKQPKPDDAAFDEAAADHAVEWIQHLRQFQGRWKGARLWLMDWQKEIIRELFGWKLDGLRLYRSAYIEAPRKSGKSTMAAAIGLYLALGEDEPSPEVYFAAYDRDQAKVCYDMARYIVEQDDELLDATAIYLSRNEIQLLQNPGGKLKPLSRENLKQFGLNVHGLIYDEVMTLKSREMWDALLTAQGSREQPLCFAISTAGWERTSLCYEQHEVVRQISEGTTFDPTFLGVVYGAPEDADWTEEEVWKAANPSLGESASVAFYREKCQSAKNKPTEQNAFRTLLLSQWVGQAERFLEMTAWDGCMDAPDLVPGSPAFGGLDLSATQDLTAFTVVVPRDLTLEVRCWAFLPAEGIRDREKRDRVPYRVWADQGHLILTPGETIDYDYVRAAITEAAELFDLIDVEYDRWNSSQLVQDLEKEGVVAMIATGQGFASMSAPMKELQKGILERRYAFGANPLLRWCASNVSAAVDAAGNVKPDKSRSAHRIDPITALIMATDGWMRRGRTPPRESIYSKRGMAVA